MNLFNVLHINNYFGLGGAFLGAYRLHQHLLELGIKSVFGYADNMTPELDKASINASDSICIRPSKHKLDDLIITVSGKVGLNYVGNLSSYSLKKNSFYESASIVNFHILHDDFFSYLALPALTKDKPAVWTLHDMWSFTGHCAYSYDCLRWQTGCGKCPYPDALPPINRDATHLEWKLKNWVYSRSNLTIVTPSKWLSEQAKQSMLKNFPIHHIPYGLDTEIYQPLDFKECRVQLGIPVDKKVLIFGAQTLTNPRKGADLLVKALSRLPASIKAETVLLIFGDSGGALSEAVEMTTHYLGYVSSDRLKAVAYSAADLFLFPTRADIFGLVALEAAACGTPTVAFNVGGVPDIVRPGITGYLATPEDADDFCNGIVELLENQSLRDRMSHYCREIAVKEFSLELQAKRYIKLYQNILKI